MKSSPEASMSGDVSEAKLRILRFAAEYGPQIDFGGRGARSSERRAAKECLEDGLLKGHVRNASITDAGRRALSERDKT